MHFEHIHILWLLLTVPLMTVAFLWRQRQQKRRLEAFAGTKLQGRLQPDASHRRPWTKHLLLCLAVALLIVAWANPQYGSIIAEGEQSGIDMAVCIDVSNSMLAQDMKPNRLERSKQVVKNLMNRLGGDRVSLIIFAGNAYIQMPLTNDYGATKMFLDQISTNLITTQGTAIGDAIDKGMSTLGYTESNSDEAQWEPNKSRAIVVISDGENHEDDAVDAAKRAAKEGIMVCTIGIGAPEGSQIPIVNERGQVVDWRKDNEGRVITTRLNEEMLRDVAKAGNGIYVHASDGNGVDNIVKQLGKLDREKFGDAQFAAYESQYQYPLAAGLFCLLLELFIFERRNPRINLNKLIRRKA